MFENSISALPSLWASMNSWFTPTVLFLLLNLMIGTIALTSSLANQNKYHNPTDNSPNHLTNLARPPSLLQRVKSFNSYACKHHQQPNIGTITVETSVDGPRIDFLMDTQKPERLDSTSQYMDDEGLEETARQESENRFDYFDGEHQENGEVMNTEYHFEQTQDSSTGNLEDNNGVTEYGFHHLNKENQEEEEENVEDADELQSLEEVYSKVTGHHHHVSRTKSDTEPSSGTVSTKLPRKMRKSASTKSAFAHFKAADIVENRRPATVRERHVAKAGVLDEEVDAKADDFIIKFKQQLKLQRIDSLTRYKEMINRASGK